MPWDCGLGRPLPKAVVPAFEVSKGSLCGALGPSASHRPNSALTPYRPLGKPIRCRGFPAWPVPGTGNARCLGPGPQTVHPFSCWGWVGATLGPNLEGQVSVGWGSQREAMFYSFRMKLNRHWLVDQEPHYSSDRTALLSLSLCPGCSSAWNIRPDQSHL